MRLPLACTILFRSAGCSNPDTTHCVSSPQQPPHLKKWPSESSHVMYYWLGTQERRSKRNGGAGCCLCDWEREQTVQAGAGRQMRCTSNLRTRACRFGLTSLFHTAALEEHQLSSWTVIALFWQADGPKIFPFHDKILQIQLAKRTDFLIINS